MPVVTLKTVFVHVPKTGGKSMYKILERWYGKEKCRYISIAECPHAKEIIKTEDYQCFYGPFGYVPIFGCRYISLVRHPVRRVVSYYQWLRDKNPKIHPGAEYAKGDLLEFIESRWHRIENNQVACLAGYGQDPQCEMGILDKEQAIENLKGIDHLGTTAAFNDFVEGIGLVGSSDEIPQLNKTEWQDYPDDVLDLISQRNTLDWELYEAAKRMTEYV